MTSKPQKCWHGSPYIRYILYIHYGEYIHYGAYIQVYTKYYVCSVVEPSNALIRLINNFLRSPELKWIIVELVGAIPMNGDVYRT